MEKMTLIVVPPAFGLPNVALFSVKAEALLRMAGVDYELQPGRPDKAPKGKLPVLHDGERVIPDSCHIQQYLEDEKGIDFDGHLTPHQRAEAVAFRRLVEEHFYFAQLYSLWIDHADVFRDQAFAEVPKLMRNTVFRMVQKKIRKSLHGQGLGRHTREQIYAFGVEDLAALEARLMGKHFFFGERVSSIDAAAFAALHLLARAPLSNPLTQFVTESKVLTAYESRVFAEIYGAEASLNQAA